MPAEPPLEVCDSQDLTRMLAVSTAWLERHSGPINALNVFPVPDGDTGINMLLTMQAALQEVGRLNNANVGEVAAALAHGALMGARGNSGVILSQVFRGMAEELHEAQTMGPTQLARALVQGSETAYQGVIEPVEGTILTVARDASDAARAAAQGGATLVEVLESTVSAARASVARTPTLLAVLREAGVVDAGGQGLYIILDGFLRYSRREALEGVELQTLESAAVEAPAAGDLEWGYCTEFIVQGEDLAFAEFRERISSMGDSALVVGDDSLIKVHVHTFDPGEVLSLAAQRGVLHKIKIDNMQDQHDIYRQLGRAGGETPSAEPQPQETVFGRDGSRGTTSAAADPEPLAAVVVAPGDGLARVFQSLGAAAVVPGGQTMNPSTDEILAAIEGVGSHRIVMLPNNPNVIMAAEKAAALSKKEVAVVPTRTVPQGIGALLAIDPDLSLEESARSMQDAAAAVRTVEITRAVRDAEMGEVRVSEGDFLALLDDSAVAGGESLEMVVRRALDRVPADEGELITLYHGEGVSHEEAVSLEKNLRRWYPDLEVEVVDGGQPHYPFILSIE